LTISKDGRYLAITVYKSDSIAQQFQLDYLSEVFIYDLKNKQFLSVNLSSEGEQGNHASYNANISSDGSSVIFVSRANTLIKRDNNKKADVFIRDLNKNLTEIISVNRDDILGNANSGTNTVPGITGWGLPISVSDDGRFITYLSLANNLAPSPVVICGQIGLPVCTHVYVHDRETGKTELILAGRGRDSFYQDVSISGDGRWVMVVEQLFRCFQGDFCSELWLIDRQEGTQSLINPIREILSLGKGIPDQWPVSSYEHDSMVNTIDFSPDGDVIATGTNDGMIRLWRLASDEPPINLIEHSLPVTEIMFTPDGKSLVSSSTDGTIYFWQVDTSSLEGRLLKYSRPITSLMISGDGKMLAAGSVGTAWIWQISPDEFKLIDSIEMPGNYINDVDFSPDGALLALAVSDGTSWIYQLDNRKVILRLGGHEGRVYTLRFSPDGRFIATGSEDKTVNLWELQKDTDGKIEPILTSTFEHNYIVKSLMFSPDGKILATVALDKQVNLFSVPEGKLLEPPISVHLDEVVSLDFSDDGHTLAAGTIGGKLHLWQIEGLDIK
ncbi:MAG: WD40 repeat domain-containing protein, partial [Anaerolineales bacterium]|nr:WD40 repeat domain-containing protein [Anaerolineales bacterium]